MAAFLTTNRVYRPVGRNDELWCKECKGKVAFDLCGAPSCRCGHTEVAGIGLFIGWAVYRNKLPICTIQIILAFHEDFFKLNNDRFLYKLLSKSGGELSTALANDRYRNYMAATAHRWSTPNACRMLLLYLLLGSSYGDIADLIRQWGGSSIGFRLLCQSVKRIRPRFHLTPKDFRSNRESRQEILRVYSIEPQISTKRLEYLITAQFIDTEMWLWIRRIIAQDTYKWQPIIPKLFQRLPELWEKHYKCSTYVKLMKHLVDLYGLPHEGLPGLDRMNPEKPVYYGVQALLWR